MAAIELTKLWINLLSTGQGVAFPSLGTDSDLGVAGTVRTYAGGRQRYVSREGRGGQLERTLRLVSQRLCEVLESWIGQTVMLRDARGQWWWGVFSKVTRRAVKGSTLYDVTIGVELVTQSEGV